MTEPATTASEPDMATIRGLLIEARDLLTAQARYLEVAEHDAYPAIGPLVRQLRLGIRLEKQRIQTWLDTLAAVKL